MAEPAQATIRVVVASDFFLTREGLGCLLAGVPGIEVVGRVDSHAATLEAASRDQPDVVVVGIRAGRAASENTMAAARLLRSDHPAVGVVVVALEGDHFALTTDFRPWCSISAMNRLGQTGADPASAACKDR